MEHVKEEKQKKFGQFFLFCRVLCFFCINSGGDGEHAWNDQEESTKSTLLAGPRLDEAQPVSTLSSSVSEQLSVSLSRGKHQRSGFNPEWMIEPKYSRWSYKTEYSNLFCAI